MYSAIFSDIDGTLFRSDLTIGEKTKEAIRQAVANGLRMVLCSGRYITGMERASEQLGVPVIYAAINGALVKDGEIYLREHRIDSSIYSSLASFLHGKVSSLIASLIDTETNLSELEELEKLIEQKKEELKSGEK